MTNTDIVRDWLLKKSNGSNYISCDGLESILPPQNVISRGSFFPAFYNLRSKGEIETDVITSEGGRPFVKGIRLKKMPSASTIIRKEAEVRKATTKPQTVELRASATLPNVIDYLRKKNALAEIQQKLKDSGFDNPEGMINFEPNPLAEEAVSLLDLVERAQTALNEVNTKNHELSIENETLTQINKRYSDMLKLDPKDYVEPNAAGKEG